MIACKRCGKQFDVMCPECVEMNEGQWFQKYRKARRWAAAWKRAAKRWWVVAQDMGYLLPEASKQLDAAKERAEQAEAQLAEAAEAYRRLEAFAKSVADILPLNVMNDGHGYWRQLADWQRKRLDEV